MKYFGYSLMIVLALLMVSFIPDGKRRKATLPSKAPYGHVQWIREVQYHAIIDSTGAILKGDIISDTDYNPRKDGRDDAKLRRNNAQPIEYWAYDEYGDETVDVKYHANGTLFNMVTHIYYENGDIKEVIDSTTTKGNAMPAVQMQQYTYKYDSSGNVLVSNKWQYYISNRDNLQFTRILNFYDSSGKLREAMTFNTDTINPISITWSTYNMKGKLVETDERHREGNPTELAPFEKNDYWYDKRGRLYDKATYHPKVGLAKDEKITFDSTGKTITTYSYAMNRMLTGTVVKRIFTATNTTQEDTYDGDGFLTEYTISHDSAKHLMDKGVFHITYQKVMGADHKYHNAEPGDTVMVHHIINDGHFNTVVDDNFSNEGNPTSQKSFQYTYDSVGNWIQKIIYNKDSPVKIIEREIVYFKD